MKTEAGPLIGERVGIFGKGGSGKSTVTVLLARALHRHGYQVCVLDADSTNIGLHRALGLEKAPDSLIDYYGGMVFSGGAVTCPVDNPTPLQNAHTTLEQLPGRFVGQTDEGIRLLSTGKMGERGAGAGCDGPMAKIARDLRVRMNGEECVTLVDFKAGMEDSARGVIVGLDWAVIVVDPTQAALEMAVHMKDVVEQIKQGAMPATAHLGTADLVETARNLYERARIEGVLVVVNRCGPESSDLVHSLLSDRSIRPVATIRADSSVSLSWLLGERLEAKRAENDVEGLVHALEARGGEAQPDPLSVPVHPQFTY